MLPNHVTFVKREVTWKKIVGIMENFNVSNTRNLATWKSITVIKITIKKTLLKNIIKSNTYSMLIKNLLREKETGT